MSVVFVLFLFCFVFFCEQVFAIVNIFSQCTMTKDERSTLYHPLLFWGVGNGEGGTAVVAVHASTFVISSSVCLQHFVS